MTTEEAKNNIGKPFKWQWMDKWDTIVSIRESDGYIIGEFLEVPIEECRLKQEQPEQLKKKYDK